MSIMLGHLTVKEIEKRIGIDFPDDVRNFMNVSNQPETSDIKKGKWHCFDIPFNLVCGDIETAQKIYDSVKNRSRDVKEQLGFSIAHNN